MCEGSGCGSVVREVASVTRGPRLESSHWQNFYIKHIEKTKIKKKRPGTAHLKLKCCKINNQNNLIQSVLRECSELTYICQYVNDWSA